MNKEFEEEAQRFVESKLKKGNEEDMIVDNHLVELYTELFTGLSVEPSTPDFNLPDDVVQLLLVREARKGVVRYYLYILLTILAGVMLFCTALLVLNNPILTHVFQYLKVHIWVFMFITACLFFIQMADKFLLKRKAITSNKNISAII